MFAALAAVEIQPARRIAFTDRLRRVFFRLFGKRDLSESQSKSCTGAEDRVAHFVASGVER